MIVFAGPSVAGVDLSEFANVTFLPPCRQGDVYLAALENPSAIGIIDGYFEGVPSVWHKEILWAMMQGIPVLGASSMGALRAAELDAFGMIGIGEVYKGYNDGTYEDDDEVALLHGPEELGFPQLSIAMVNVRATCRKAIKDGIISGELSTEIINAAKSGFYKKRNWQTIFSSVGVEAHANKKLLNWFVTNSVDQKKLDALELLEALQNSKFAPCKAGEFEFEVTNFWHRNTRKWRQCGFCRPEETSETGYRLFGKEDL